MSISRRQFIFGTAAVLILPSCLDKISAYRVTRGRAADRGFEEN